MRGNSAGGGERPRAGQRAFTLLEVLVALAVIAVGLMALHQGFASALFVNSSTRGLWKAILFVNNELQHAERSSGAGESVGQGEYPPEHELAGYTWRREIKDEEPFPGVRVRKILFEVDWVVGNAPQTYRAEIYVPAQ
jgi:prepilin-type N-terminal cleavage/methylation domain-containing protein